MRFREATADDAQACAEVHVASWKAGYEGILPAEYLDQLSVSDRLLWWRDTLKLPSIDRPLRVMVIQDEASRVCGLGATKRLEAEDKAELTQMYLAPSAWGTGAADILMDALLNELARDGVEWVSLRVARDNGRARRFYERRGWTLTEGSEAMEEIWGVSVLTLEYREDIGRRA